ncbi:hypothetical protein BDAP_001817 [Binucleata daphniae]
MENIDLLIRKIRIDYPQAHLPSYNPLSLAIKIHKKSSKTAVEYRNTYHELEDAMHSIIDTTFQGFSDSLYSYKNCYKNVNTCIEKLQNMKDSVKYILSSFDIDTTELDAINKNIKTKEEMLEHLQKIEKLKNRIVSSNTTNRYTKNKSMIEEGYNILECYKLFNDLKEIKIISSYGKKIVDKRNEFVNKLCIKIIKCIFESEEKSVNDIKAIFVVDCLEDLDKRLSKIVEHKLFFDIQNIINSVKDEQMNKELKKNELYKKNDQAYILAKKITLYCKKIINNHKKICELIFENHTSDNNFFEKSFDSFTFFDKQSFIDNIKQQMKKLINVYTETKNEEEKKMFVLDDIEDTIDYKKIQLEEPTKESEMKNNVIARNIDTNLQEYMKTFGKCCNTKKEYEIIFENDYDFVYYIYVDIFDEMKEELKIMLEKKFFRVKEEKINKKLNKIMRSYWKTKNNKLAWFDKFDVIVKENSCYKSEFSYKILCNVFEYLLQSSEDNFYFLYKNELIKHFFCNIANEQNNIFDLENKTTLKENKEFDEHNNFITSFVNKLNEYKIEHEELKAKQKRYEVCVATNQTIINSKNIYTEEIKKYESIEMNKKLESILKRMVKIECKYKVAMQLQIIIDMYFYFDIYFISNTFGINSDAFVCMVEIYKFLYKLKNDEMIEISSVFICIKSYIFTNIQKLNVTNKDELKLFVSDLKLLEEIICNYEMSPLDNFDECYNFFDACTEGSAKTREEKIFCNKFAN